MLRLSTEHIFNIIFYFLLNITFSKKRFNNEKLVFSQRLLYQIYHPLQEVCYNEFQQES